MAVFLQASCFHYPIVLRRIYTIALYVYCPIVSIRKPSQGSWPRTPCVMVTRCGKTLNRGQAAS